MAEGPAKREILPDEVRHEVGRWLERDRGWKAELASVGELTGAGAPQAEPARLREAARYPAVAEAIRRETIRLALLPIRARGRTWTGDTPLVAGDRIAWRADGTVLQVVVVFPGESGGMRASDRLQLRMVQPEGLIVEVGARSLLEGGCFRAAWSDTGLRALEVARKYSVLSDASPRVCDELVPGDRIAWTGAAGLNGEAWTIEAEFVTRTERLGRRGYGLELRVIGAFGPGAPEPGSVIERAADAVTARGCYRAPWLDEARRERILHPPRQARDRTQQLEQEETLKHQHERSHSKGISM